MIFALGAFFGVLAIVFGVYWLLILRPEGAAERELERRLNPAGALPTAERLSLMKRVAPLSTVPLLELVLTRSGSLVDPMMRLIERSGLKITVGQLILSSLFFGSFFAFVVLHYTGFLLAAAIAAVLFGAAPFMAVKIAANKRVAKFEEQFPEAIDLIARALRAGHALTTGLGMVAEEAQDPVRTEFQLLYDRQNFGMPLSDAMKNLGERVPLLDARFFVTAVLTQREAGGNLAEVLDSLSSLIRERFRLKRQVRVLSAHGRMTGWVLGTLPLVLAGFLFMVAPAQFAVLVTDPLGIRMVAGAAVLQIIGVFIMRKIVNIEV